MSTASLGDKAESAAADLQSLASKTSDVTTPKPMLPLTTRAYEIKKVHNANRVPKDFHTPVRDGSSSNAPKFVDDLIDRMNITSHYQVSAGIDFTIDVQPDFRPIYLVVSYYCLSIYRNLEQKNHSSLTPSSLIGYCMAIMYAHLLISDVYIRNVPSNFANHFMSDAGRRNFLSDLLALPVPEFLVKILNVLTATSDPRRTGVEYIPSFAGFSYAHDFGRFFPIAIFFAAHHIAATTKANDDPQELFNKYMHTQITTGINTARIGNYFGALLDISGSATNYNSDLLTSLQGSVNAVTQRTLGQRFAFRPMYIATTDIGLNPNPYVLCLNADIDNLNMSMVNLKALAHVVTTEIPHAGPLGSRYSSLSGLGLLMHAYSPITLQTWHLHSIPTAIPKDVASASPATRAKTLKFMQPTTFVKDHDLPLPSEDKGFDLKLYLVTSKKIESTNEVGMFDEVLFDPHRNVFPHLRVFDAYDSNPGEIYKPLIAGLIIESSDIDGAMVPQSDPNVTLTEDNSQLLQSAIPIASIVRANDPVHIYSRAYTSSEAQKVKIALGDLSSNRAPVFPTAVNGSPTLTTIPSYVIRAVNTLTKAFFQFGYKARVDVASSQTKPTIPEHSIAVWSPYRFVTVGNHTNREDNVYMLTNFRTIYGTNVTLVETRHYTKLIPHP